MTILIVDDNEMNLYQLQVLLGGHGYKAVTAVNGAEALIAARQNPPDLIISDILMPVMDGFTLCGEWKKDERLRQIPFVFYTATYTDERDRDFALSLGAEQFLVKPEEPEVFMRTILEVTQQVQRPSALPFTPPESTTAHLEVDERPKEESGYLKQYNQVLIRKLEAKMQQLEQANRELERDIAERERAEAEHFRLVTAIEQSAEAVVITNTSGDIEYVNPAFTRITGYSREEVLGHNPRMLKSDKQDAGFYQQLWATILKGEIWRGEITNQRKDGKLYTEEMHIAPVRCVRGEITHFIATKQDVTERKALEAHVRQAAKMEAIGRLAGGVAHDFNNLLIIINGYSELVLNGLDSDNPLRGDLNEIMKAADRAASLTRQLLAFSRQQVLAPRVLDLNKLVAEVGKMLHRLIGEDINLVTELDPKLGRVKADAGQIEQILMNLAVNARDAMPEGGKLVIETANVELDEVSGRSHKVVAPGRYVMLSVSDTGIGMDEVTQSHIFEPFFTTKEKDKGTGLGLATVYGIVEQSGGHIVVYTEPGRGSTFKICLPRAEETGESADFPKPPGHTMAASETILLVEDEKAVRALAARILQGLGYHVLESTNPEDALQICARHTGPIDLLLTDLVLPTMSGRKVAESLNLVRPGMKVLYMSGYTDDAIVRSGVLEATTAFLQKPFAPATLARKVREVLDVGRQQCS